MTRRPCLFALALLLAGSACARDEGERLGAQIASAAKHLQRSNDREVFGVLRAETAWN